MKILIVVLILALVGCYNPRQYYYPPVKQTTFDANHDDIPDYIYIKGLHDDGIPDYFDPFND